MKKAAFHAKGFHAGGRLVGGHARRAGHGACSSL
jgi:hypothetical protein